VSTRFRAHCAVPNDDPSQRVRTLLVSIESVELDQLISKYIAGDRMSLLPGRVVGVVLQASDKEMPSSVQEAYIL